ncbi:conserved Plasmodium protein, unknown function [Plasmodium knowlesi strain H]|uniref:Mini-chromosome maintenance complex-binding protein n=3 Tax=Plasmodium knowlesi TaxID=5850 RepID=A0A5K1U7G5_PLAKH|nr:mini-chromosome maintenance complex-binding protein, putative [Plasmodium knowlesi strain H]OTN67765.1 Uncharacterized protein PKNOH_S05390000 [Plasmodium knowlesi]CAA9990487.1 mini-chromosome maintenance complex-binding protein, putative [Plasmodium knowlesi strain H]SBO19708.1 conserved Plasmodium protein, unknown function [Plasmodium knowlesi strain H]SBO22476.1 conserved Plasmodium protein, unknown function [Plasmodium knowlesi strain H]VVS79961.1 mini-chromosome maintenance complex-bin|eukprot:XP_002260876.1 hypothetical protein, conserved in Plasmodium species [Plasmodium knowlesi strain H]
MNVLTQIDDCFANYIKIHGAQEVDSYWDEGIVVNKYIELGNGHEKKGKTPSSTKEHVEQGNQEDASSAQKSNCGNEGGLNLSKSTLAKESLFTCNDVVEECVCLNTVDNIENLKDATLVRWTCMVQQIISPESYVGIYKLRNKKNGEIVLKSSKYRDYIDTDDKWEIMEDNEKKNVGEYYELNYEQYCKMGDDERGTKDTHHTGGMNPTDETNPQVKNKSTPITAGTSTNQVDQETCPKNYDEKKKDHTVLNNQSEDIPFYESDNNFKKYWKRYLFLCTNVPGNKSTWVKELCEYSSYYDNCENFLKNESVKGGNVWAGKCTAISNCSTDEEGNAEGGGFSTDDVRLSRETICSSEFEPEEWATAGHATNQTINHATDHTTDRATDQTTNRATDQTTNHATDHTTGLPMDTIVSGAPKRPRRDPEKKNKLRCIIKIYDDNSQYNGKNEKDFLKLNDVIEVIGIYRKHQIKHFENCEKNLNFYFYYDQNFLKYPCIHAFRYIKVKRFNPLSSCILFKNELCNILQSGPFSTVGELRRHLLMYISNIFSHDLLLAHYFFFYLCGSYIEENKLKLGKISLNVFNISTDGERCASPTETTMEEKQKISEGEKEEKEEKEKKVSPKEPLQKGENCSKMMDEYKEVQNKSYPRHAIQINKMMKNLVPLYRYIPLCLEKLSSQYLVSVMNHQNGELKKGKLQLANNTYLAFDECVLDEGKCNTISTKNFLCIERLITSQEIPFIFNTDITFETQNNVLILSRKKSMYVNYVDIHIPVCHQRGKGHGGVGQSGVISAGKVEQSGLRKMDEVEKEGKTEEKGQEKTEGTKEEGAHGDAKKPYKENEPEKNFSAISAFSAEFINTCENYYPKEDELMQFRRYINYILSKSHPAKIHSDVTTYITDSFVSLRQTSKDVNQFVLNSWICMSRIWAFSEGCNEISRECWDYIMKLEAERRLRLSQLDALYI